MEMVKHSEEVEQWLPGSEHEPADYDVPFGGTIEDDTSDCTSNMLDYLLFVMPAAGSC